MEEINVSLTFNVIGKAVFNSSFRSPEGKVFVDNFRKSMVDIFTGAMNPIRRVISSWTSIPLMRKVDGAIKKALIDRFNELKNEGRANLKQLKSIGDLVLRQKLDTTEDISSDTQFLKIAASK